MPVTLTGEMERYIGTGPSNDHEAAVRQHPSSGEEQVIPIASNKTFMQKYWWAIAIGVAAVGYFGYKYYIKNKQDGGEVPGGSGSITPPALATPPVAPVQTAAAA